MRWAIVAGVLAASAQAHAQDGAQMMTLAEVRQRRAELAGLFIRVENVTVSGFTIARGGLARQEGRERGDADPTRRPAQERASREELVSSLEGVHVSPW